MEKYCNFFTKCINSENYYYYLIQIRDVLNDLQKKKIKDFLSANDLSFLEVKVANSSVKKLPRPTDLIKIKNQFMK